MRIAPFGRVGGLLARTARWAWERDEVDRTTSLATIKYTLVLYAVVLGIITGASGVFTMLGYRELSISIWIFGILFTSFIGAINVSWEALRYWTDRRATRSGPGDTGPDRELAIGFRVAEDTKIGFVVTVIALVVLVTSLRIAVELLTLF